ncbi:lipid-binding SYLF domain-containing protein [Lysobacter sp. CFH 32150]|uniref:lipid-binding SYLF domain-containing protein n=1 Tax=Lysobacter sp. CFH 32150 TaxID=2927128 RepID=UPI001FA7CC38|nr:lipid-binding SYLF domain-containing protein [Lysobacter sp. CFH 32150]MCI4567904.1 lipid-binding SYLF domain-containing protein [Lysobacter sp. CFH 32150]
MSVQPRPYLRVLVLLLAGLFATTTMAGSQEDDRARNAVRVLTDFQAIPESAIPDKLLDEARAIVVVPDSIKAGLVIGGRRGHGLMAVKNPDGTWSNPSFVSLTGGSIGFQAGVQSADIVLVFRSDRGLESIVNGKFTLGADAGVAAGPLGRNASTATDGELKAEIWSWSRARGLFAGVALDGAVLAIDDRANEAVYGRDTTPRMIFEGRINAQPSSDVVAFRDQLEEASATARSNRGTNPPVTTAPVATSATANTATSVETTTEPATATPQPADEAQGAMFEPVPNTPSAPEPLPETPKQP